MINWRTKAGNVRLTSKDIWRNHLFFGMDKDPIIGTTQPNTHGKKNDIPYTKTSAQNQ
ncbi:hypothetical protein PHLCEN_2v7679 [Hermanssonia centrifuga]|uniref:Uncharacterized protein n=1 Tax=Hermanssonia centrifuga TaxID=98765 RepID=A0A2R6NW08_9APHY|nr:hypothetical protein PHLCEN_2v7679 [Hermanssonia centrifuga]